MAYVVFRSCIAAILKPKYKGYRCFRIKLLVRAIVDGILNKRGKSVDPSQYINDIKQIEKRVKNAYKN